MTIHEIKDRTLETNPEFFTRETMKFFHQTLRDYSVTRRPDGKYYLNAPMRDFNGKVVGKTERIFNPKSNELERVL